MSRVVSPRNEGRGFDSRSVQRHAPESGAFDLVQKPSPAVLTESSCSGWFGAFFGKKRKASIHSMAAQPRRSYGHWTFLPGNQTRPTPLGGVRLGEDIPGDTTPKSFAAQFAIGGWELACIAHTNVPESSDDLLNLFVVLEEARFHAVRFDLRGAASARFEQFLKLLAVVRKRFRIAVVARVDSEMALESLLPHFDGFEVDSANLPLVRTLSFTSSTVFLRKEPTTSLEDFSRAIRLIETGGRASTVLVDCGTSVGGAQPFLDVEFVSQMQRETRYPVIGDCASLASDWSYCEPVASALTGAGVDGLVLPLNPDRSLHAAGYLTELLPDFCASLLKRVRAIHYTLKAASHCMHFDCPTWGCLHTEEAVKLRKSSVL